MDITPDRSDFQEQRTSPTVSKEKWANHARQKLLKGYVLIVSNSKKSANFYLAGKGYEMCPFHIAKRLVKEGLVVENGTHYLGSVYTLSSALPPPEIKPVPLLDEPEETPADEMETILDQLGGKEVIVDTVEAEEDELDEDEEDELDEDEEDEEIL
jgi:hypothetical protein